jgi:predicted ribosome quality control (RQC) complex YloA/Tae2 family protein
MALKRKDAMTSFDVAAVVEWLNRNCRRARLVNIYMVEGMFLLKLKALRDLKVVVEPGKRVHPTSFDVAEKKMPPPLVMAIRKRVRNDVLESVEQLSFDRIAVLRFRSGFTLVAELIPRGVVALLDPDGRIVVSTEYREMRDRAIRPGLKYQPPPQHTVHPNQLDRNLLVKRVRESQRHDAVRALVVGLGYPGEVVEEALFRVGLTPSSPASSIEREAEPLVEVFRRILRELKEGYVYTLLEGGKAVTVVPFEPKGLAEAYELTTQRSELDRGYDEYFTLLAREKMVEEMVKRFDEEKAKLEHSLRVAVSKLRELEEKKRRLEVLAEQVSLNIASIYEALSCANEVRERSGWDYIVGSCPQVVDVNPSLGAIYIAVGREVIEFKLGMDPHKYVVDMYRRIGELESKIERAKKAVEELKEKLARLATERARARARASIVVRRRFWFEKYHWSLTSNGFLVLAGRDAAQNESLVRRVLEDDDIFLHADIHGGAATILKTAGREPAEQDLRDAALIAAAYSRAWKEGLASIDVFWVRGSQVSKTPPSGEYLARGAFMVYGRKNYLKGVELKLAIGLALDEDEAPHVVVGAPDLVKQWSIIYAVLVPGRGDPSAVAAKLKREFLRRVEEDRRPLVEAVAVDELRMHIPGASDIVAVVRGLGRGLREVGEGG